MPLGSPQHLIFLTSAIHSSELGEYLYYAKIKSFCTVVTVVNSDVRGSVHCSIIHKENPTRCNSVSKFLFHIYIRLNMFRATHRPSSGA